MAGANNIIHGFDERRGGEEDAKATLKGEEEETSQSARKKQKRNKPTLRFVCAILPTSGSLLTNLFSCLECVERKTKCDRGRPGCLACAKRQSGCRYSDIANLIAVRYVSCQLVFNLYLIRV
jgi:Fungal Zn(2)-Cys(6) binuclear cluster domain